MEELTSTIAIKRYFEADDGKPVKTVELKDLSPAEREELGTLCADALGATIKKAA